MGLLFAYYLIWGVLLCVLLRDYLGCYLDILSWYGGLVTCCVFRTGWDIMLWFMCCMRMCEHCVDLPFLICSLVFSCFWISDLIWLI